MIKKISTPQGNIVITGGSGDLPPHGESHASINPTQINAFFNHLIGELLTIVEASTTDEVQRKALKSVVGGLIHDKSVELQQWIIHTYEDEQKGIGSSYFPYLY